VSITNSLNIGKPWNINPKLMFVPRSLLRARDQIATTVFEIHSMDESYSSICNQALETIDAFLGYPELDAGIREHRE
jgi:hypothetical protein